jgi:tetratricopeptide (TPR) repeat protein
MDPHSAEAHVRLARYFRQSGQHAESREAITRAFELGPDEPLVLFTRAGKAMLESGPEQAVPLVRQALEQQPLSVVYRNNLASTLLAAGRHEEALQQFRRAAEINPAMENVYYDLCRALLLTGRIDEARQLSRRVEEGAAMDQLRVLLDTGERKDMASARLNSDSSSSGLLRRAEIAAFEGDTEGAFALLERAMSTVLREGSSAARTARIDDVIEQAAWSPFLHGLRDDPRWGTLVAQVRKQEVA